MASSLLVLIDDIATVLDDVVGADQGRRQEDRRRARRRPGAERAAGHAASTPTASCRWCGRWPRARCVNKAILVPAALAISAVRAVGGDAAADDRRRVPLLRRRREARAQVPAQQAEDDAHRARHAARGCADPAVDLVALEKDKIKGAVRTDFILSAEIIVITLGTVADAPFATQVGGAGRHRRVMTVGVYGLVAGIVKLDDAGPVPEPARRAAARARASAAASCARRPWLMKTLSVAGTAAMFLVGGGHPDARRAPPTRPTDPGLAAEGAAGIPRSAAPARRAHADAAQCARRHRRRRRRPRLS